MLSFKGSHAPDIEVRSFGLGSAPFDLKGVIFGLFARNGLILLVFVELNDRDGWGLEARRGKSAGAFVSLNYEFWFALHI